MSDLTLLLVAATAVVLVVVFSCLTLVALAAIGKGKNEIAEKAIGGIRQVAQEAIGLVSAGPRKK